MYTDMISLIFTGTKNRERLVGERDGEQNWTKEIGFFKFENR